MANQLIVDWSHIVGPHRERPAYCWNDATMTCIEAFRVLSTGEPHLRLSTQHLADCYDRYDPTSPHGWGKPSRALDFIERKNGNIYRDADYPPREEYVRPGECNLAGRNPGWRIDSWKEVRYNERKMEDLVNLHPVIASVASVSLAGLRGSSYVAGTVILFDINVINAKVWDHAVVIDGYGTLAGTPYWRCLNFWGPNWGDNGHCLIEKNTIHSKLGAAGIARRVCYPLVRGFNM